MLVIAPDLTHVAQIALCHAAQIPSTLSLLQLPFQSQSHTRGQLLPGSGLWWMHYTNMSSIYAPLASPILLQPGLQAIPMLALQCQHQWQ